jgi:hypothetical protein
MPDTFAEFMDTYGGSREHPVVEVGDSHDQWPTIVVRFRGHTAVLHLMGVAAGTDAEHLCIDVHAFVHDVIGRAAVFGMEYGRRYTGFDDTAPGLSHGWPAVRGVSVLIGRQSEPPSGQ